MQDKIKKVIKKIGLPVEIRKDTIIRTGTAAIYPVRSSEDKSIKNSQLFEGRTEIKRYFMFCDSSLLQGIEHGGTVKIGEHEYYILYKDDMEFRHSSYTCACIRKISRESEI